ncbi:MAG: hypothetical protein WDM86_16320 [Rhizomicrobium sp.]
MFATRDITTAEIKTARRTDRIAISTPGDFLTSTIRPFDRAGADGLLPYCLDFLRRRSVYVGGVDGEGAQAAPFYYLYLRRNATRVVSVPWESGALAPGEARAPIFLFSPGRCGSTLLSRLLFEAGIANVSEPDFYTQATTALCASPFNPFRAMVAEAAAAMGADLAAALDPVRPPVVKLRAESCRAPDLLVRPQERRTIFMTRGFEAWARSNGRAFRNGAQKSVRKYLTAMSGYAWAKRNGTCHVIHYERLLADPPAEAAALAAFLGRGISAEAVASSMKEDSQKDTPLRRGARSDLPGWERRFDATMVLWNSAKVRRARDGLGAEELCTG